jgi:hypothetical protein
MYFGIQNLSFLAQAQSVAAPIIPPPDFPTDDYLLHLRIYDNTSLEEDVNNSFHAIDLQGGTPDVVGVTGNHYDLLNGAAYASGGGVNYVAFDAANDYMGNDGDDTYVEDRGLVVDTRNPFSISVWCWFSGAVGGPSGNGIKWAGQGNTRGSSVYGSGGFSLATLNQSDGLNKLRMYGPIGHSLDTEISCPTNSWFMIGLTKNSSNHISGYINNTGVLMSSGAGDSGQRELSDKVAILELGRDYDGASYSYGSFPKRISDIRAWSGAHSPAEMEVIYNDTKSNFGF